MGYLLSVIHDELELAPSDEMAAIELSPGDGDASLG